MDLMEKTGLVTYVGKVNMDRLAPEDLREPGAQESAFDTFGWINEISGRYERTMPIRKYFDPGVYAGLGSDVAGGQFFGKVGCFDPDFEFDAIVLDDSTLLHPQPLTVHQRLERAVYLGLDENCIVRKYARGRLVGGRMWENKVIK